MEAYKKIIELKGSIFRVGREVEKLKPKAVIELRNLGYSHDDIAKVIGIGKITSIALAKKGKRKIHRICVSLHEQARIKASHRK